MSSECWYRNKEWSKEIENKFFEKLKRARRKEQYLRIQAGTIARRAPDVALSLLDQYFELSDDFEHAQAYCDMATAYIAEGEIENAINSYRKALERESAFSNLKTDAYILYPLVIVESKLTDLYQSANEILDEHQERLMFPVDHFRWHAAKAIIFTESGNNEQAARHAGQAFDAAQIKKSGFRFHQSLGLVGKEYKGLVNEIRAIHA
ncbi:tetratricopeptide repeat protein [Pseudoalteromonas sp. McH1-42]|uniref:tetratricopeptide repeat protein n=1 Tax=Pseudoalteromonas sp. McH1-42 TaxID=2917752 RepID=UPI001EF62080|nr:tetratricopeptide repeat protein [Pseudoalteromonas sp. McH1-42]MCG7564615.1 tetratricopeptide repeat protein [Pseudoalteromonas sp. McH1-42]